MKDADIRNEHYRMYNLMRKEDDNIDEHIDDMYNLILMDIELYNHAKKQCVGILSLMKNLGK